MGRSIPPILIVCASALLAGGSAFAGEREEAIELFETRIRPVLIEACYECHSAEAESIEGELTLDNRAAIERGGRSGAAVVAGDPQHSQLLQAMQYDDAALQMPPAGKLPEEVIADFKRWIELGAPDPRDGSAAPVDTIASRAAAHWAFKPPVRPSIPEGQAAQPLDRIIQAKLDDAGFTQAKPASRGVLIRRLYFDLTGLPPTWEQVQDFKAEDSPEAYESLVDRLLASPQFGERWARHWLDVARFTDTKGYVFMEDRTFPSAYKYRDWVIAALNDDMPIDRFMKYQIAADRMIAADGQSKEKQREDLAAAGFVTLGRRFINNPHDIIADRIDVVFRGLMGLTVACARCHDHKFDPIADEDYYALYGLFASSKEVQDEDLPLRLVDSEQPQNVGVFIRGSASNRTEPVARGFPKVFSSFAAPVEAGSGRLELAQAIVDPRNPLTARVFVNRVWGHLFGEPLVRTPSDFGLRCEPPQQQAALDLLAVDFVESGWSLKRLVRELVTSETYRQSSQADPALVETDPENQLLGHMNRRRRDFESMRDSLLAASGRLDASIGGASERIDTPEGGVRRTLYAHIDRQNLPSLFRAFDFASPDTHCPERLHTVVPQQALFLLNSSMIQIVARNLVSSLDSETPASAAPGERVAALYQRVLARQPSAGEVAAALDFLARNKPAPLASSPWQYGFGRLDGRESQATVQWQPLEQFIENRWQPRSAYPDPALGHLSVTPEGGHPGNDRGYCSIRRWTAPPLQKSSEKSSAKLPGKLLITGVLERPSAEGDGVEAAIVSSRRGVIAHWVLQQGRQPTNVELPDVEPGETIDFVVGCRENPGFDSYVWQVSLALETPTGTQRWSSQRDFHGPLPEPLDLWSQLAQVLLVSNEFLFID